MSDGNVVDPVIVFQPTTEEIDLSKIQSFNDLYYLMKALDVRVVVDRSHPYFEKVKHLIVKSKDVH